MKTEPSYIFQHIDAAVVLPQDADQLKEYRKEIAQAKRLILDRVQDHIVSHIAGKDTAKEMWIHFPRYTRALPSNERCT